MHDGWLNGILISLIVLQQICLRQPPRPTATPPQLGRGVADASPYYENN